MRIKTDSLRLISRYKGAQEMTGLQIAMIVIGMVCLIGSFCFGKVIESRSGRNEENVRAGDQSDLGCQNAGRFGTDR